MLFINKAAQERFWPSIYSAYPGAVGTSRTFEGFGQRDEAEVDRIPGGARVPATIGRAAIEQRARELTTRLMAGLSRLPGSRYGRRPRRSARGGRLSSRGASSTPASSRQRCTKKTMCLSTTRAGPDRGGIRVAPHLYNKPTGSTGC